MLFEKIKLEEDEKVLLIVRRHWFVFFNRIIGIILMALLPFVLLLIGTQMSTVGEMVRPLVETYTREITFFGALWVLFCWATLAQLWTDHYLDIWVVTDRRVISIDQVGFFIRSVGSFRLERLQDMNVTIPGLFATLLDYGTVEAQTASASESEFTVHWVPHPREIKATILEAADVRMHGQTALSSIGDNQNNQGVDFGEEVTEL